MRAEIQLVRNGNSTAVTIPRLMLTYLGWLPGEKMIVELLEDQSVRVRRFTASDIPPTRSPRVVYDYTEPGKK